MRAEELYRQALAAHPGHIAALGNLAGLFTEAGELGRAEVPPPMAAWMRQQH